jgi:hypothetical protein
MRRRTELLDANEAGSLSEANLQLIEPSVSDVSTTPPEFHLVIRTLPTAYRPDGDQLTGSEGRGG